jgi:hypothetical protein
VLRGLADAQHKFISIDAGAYGTQTVGIFHQSFGSQIPNRNNLNEPDDQELPLLNIKCPFAIPGYEEYPSLSYCLSPFLRIQLTEIKRI